MKEEVRSFPKLSKFCGSALYSSSYLDFSAESWKFSDRPAPKSTFRSKSSPGRPFKDKDGTKFWTEKKLKNKISQMCPKFVLWCLELLTLWEHPLQCSRHCIRLLLRATVKLSLQMLTVITNKNIAARRQPEKYSVFGFERVILVRFGTKSRPQHGSEQENVGAPH